MLQQLLPHSLDQLRHEELRTGYVFLCSRVYLPRVYHAPHDYSVLYCHSVVACLLWFISSSFGTSPPYHTCPRIFSHSFLRGVTSQQRHGREGWRGGKTLHRVPATIHWRQAFSWLFGVVGRTLPTATAAHGCCSCLHLQAP